MCECRLVSNKLSSVQALIWLLWMICADEDSGTDVLAEVVLRPDPGDDYFFSRSNRPLVEGSLRLLNRGAQCIATHQ